ncbi:hypothetical protein FDZ71_00230 [bacterium]|nr:MAG: hypothetical protein FDZ71_00230 [bacterium]
MITVEKGPDELYPARPSRMASLTSAFAALCILPLSLFMIAQRLPPGLRLAAAAFGLAAALAALVLVVRARKSTVKRMRDVLLGLEPQRPPAAARSTLSSQLGLLGVLVVVGAGTWIWTDAITSFISSRAAETAMVFLAASVVPPSCVFLVGMAVASRQAEKQVEMEVRQGLHGDADPLYEGPSFTDEWNAARPRARLFSALIAGIPLLAMGGMWLWEASGRHLELLFERVPYRALVGLWWLVVLSMTLPLAVLTYWDCRWRLRERTWLRAVNQRTLLDYLNRERRPRLSLEEWQARTKNDGGKSVRLGVIPGLAVGALFIAAPLVYLLAHSLALGSLHAVISTPLWTLMLLWFVCGCVAVTGVVSRQLLIYELLRCPGGGDSGP